MEFECGYNSTGIFPIIKCPLHGIKCKEVPISKREGKKQ